MMERAFLTRTDGSGARIGAMVRKGVGARWGGAQQEPHT